MNKLTKFSLLSTSLLIVSSGAIAANIPAIKESYPEINSTIVELITTLPSATIILSVFLSHKVARRIGYKKTVQLGILLVLISGIFPALVHSFGLLFLSRLLFGIGIGLFNPLLFSFASTFYKGKELSSVIGLQSSFEGIGGMLLTFAVGQILIVNWRMSFLVYLLALPILFLFTYFVPEISSKEEVKKEYRQERIDKKIYFYAPLLIVSVTVYMSFAVKATSLLLEKGYGNATDGSNLLALVGLGAMTAGILFGQIFTWLKNWTLPVSSISLGIAMLLIAVSPNMWLASFSAIFCGFSFRTFVPYLFNEVNQSTSKNAERSTSILLISFNVGAAFTPISVSLFEKSIPFDGTSGIFIGEGFLMFILAIVGIVFIIKNDLAAKKNIEECLEQEIEN